MPPPEKKLKDVHLGKDGEYLTVGSNGINSYDHVLFGRIKQTRYGGIKKQDREEWKLCDSRDRSICELSHKMGVVSIA
jgi:hypothetical protein